MRGAHHASADARYVRLDIYVSTTSVRLQTIRINPHAVRGASPRLHCDIHTGVNPSIARSNLPRYSCTTVLCRRKRDWAAAATKTPGQSCRRRIPQRRAPPRGSSTTVTALSGKLADGDVVRRRSHGSLGREIRPRLCVHLRQEYLNLRYRSCCARRLPINCLEHQFRRVAETPHCWGQRGSGDDRGGMMVA